MEIKHLTPGLSVAAQVTTADLQTIKDRGFKAVICNRPDGEGADQPTFVELEKAAKKLGIAMHYMPVKPGIILDPDIDAFRAALTALPGPVLGFCRTGMRTTTLWSLSQGRTADLAQILAVTKAAGFDMGGVVRRIANGGTTPTDTTDASYDIVIVGAGAAGIAAADHDDVEFGYF